jgi:hypothetical protein
MIERYQRLKAYCEDNEWAAALSAILLLTMLATLVILLLQFQESIIHWLSSAVLINGLIAAAATLIIGALSASIFCLSFSACSIEERTEKVIHRHRPMMSDSLKIVKNLGVNPKRRRRPDHNASA